MRKQAIALIFALTVLLCACTSENNGNANNESPKTDTTASQETEAGKPDITEFLDGSKSVINAKNGQEVKLTSFSENNKELGRYSIVDLDGDKNEEYLVEYAGSGDTAILHQNGAEWYAYMIPLRARMDLKTDGEMMWSKGASHSGTQRVSFADGEMNVTVLLDSDFDKDVYYIDGKEVSHDEAMKAWENFDSKENAEWFDAYAALDY